MVLRVLSVLFGFAAYSRALVWGGFFVSRITEEQNKKLNNGYPILGVQHR